MIIHTQIFINPHHSGFGMYQAEADQTSSGNSFAIPSDLMAIIHENADACLPLDEALLDPEFFVLGIEDISGRIYNSLQAGGSLKLSF